MLEERLAEVDEFLKLERIAQSELQGLREAANRFIPEQRYFVMLHFFVIIDWGRPRQDFLSIQNRSTTHFPARLHGENLPHKISSSLNRNSHRWNLLCQQAKSAKVNLQQRFGTLVYFIIFRTNFCFPFAVQQVIIWKLEPLFF